MGEGVDDGGTGGRGGREGALRDAVARFAEAAEGLAELDGAWASVEGADRDGLYRDLERARARLTIADAGYLSARGKRGVVSDGDAAVAALARTAYVSRAEARRRIRAARRVQDEDAVPQSEPVARARVLPAVRARVAEGAAGPDAIEIVDRELDKLPAKALELVRAADPHIADLIGKIDVDDLRALGTMLRAMLGLDDPYTDEDRARRRGLDLSGPDPDNMRRLSGWVTPEFSAMILRLWADHARPGALLPDGTPPAADRRSARQRRHDALMAAVGAGYRPAWEDAVAAGSGDARDDGDPAGPAPAPGGDGGGSEGTGGPGIGPDDVPPPPAAPLRPGRGAGTVVAYMGVDELAARAGVAVTDVGSTISVPSALRLASASNVFLSVLDLRGQTMWFGRSRRTASLAQYLALGAEEGCSSAPGTGAPPAMCDVHHVHAWGNGGGTDIRNLTLVDRRFHGTIDDDAADRNRWWSRPGPDAAGGPPGPPGSPVGPSSHGPDEPPGGAPVAPPPDLPSGAPADPGDSTKVLWIPPAPVDPGRRPRVNVHPGNRFAPGAVVRRRGAGRPPDRGRRGGPAPPGDDP
ncbi:DUF222 domain-containing protein [Corynebacterium sp. 335C]